MPHALLAVPATQVPPLQQPPLQSAFALHVVVQLCVLVLQASPAGQSVGALQPQDPLARHTGPDVPWVQFAHKVPFAPHAAGMVPDWHVPLVALEQHPVGHGEDELHAKLQMPFEQPCAPEPQSLTVPQPHCPPPVTVSHAWPCVLAEHELHVPPLFPQAVGAVPVEHVPPLQQPPLHGDDGPHTVVHTPPLHAVLSGQSAALVQPQLPFVSQT